MNARNFLKICGLLAAIGISGCRRDTQAPEPPAPRVEGEKVDFASDSPQLASLTIETAQPRKLAVTNVTGRLYWDDDLTVRVFTPVAGRVTSIPGELGKSVAIGAPLAEIDSPDFGQAQADARTADGNLRLADKALDRAKELFEHGAAAQKDVESADAADVAAVAERDRAQAKLALYGGSTGGWEAAAMQIFYPTFFNDAFIACPDPIDFRAYQIVNLYEDPNALWLESNWGKVPRPSQRETNGSVVSTMDRMTRRELALGTHGRSTEQFNIWQAVYSPVGDDGYPKPIYDSVTGAIDHNVANYWKEHYDLRYILQRDWKTLGPNLVGKLHFAVGDMDSYYLNNAVHLMQDFLESTNYPYYAGDFDYGPGRPHCYTGKDGLPVEAAGLTWSQRVIRQSVERMLKTAPAGADVTSWRY